MTIQRAITDHPRRFRGPPARHRSVRCQLCLALSVALVGALVGLPPADACTTGAARGQATEDGRPIIWHNEDLELSVRTPFLDKDQNKLTIEERIRADPKIPRKLLRPRRRS